MRQHFKIGQGYLNVDQQVLIFTRSGNWTEAGSAPELDRSVRSQRSIRVGFGLLLIAAGGTFLAANTLRAAWGNGSVLLMIGALGFGQFRMYGRLRDDLGSTYRIPFNKVMTLAYEGGDLNILFLDGAMKECRSRIAMDEEAAAFVMAAWHGRPDLRI